MSLDIQAQVESVLSSLLKVAVVELTRLFESRFPPVAAAAEEEKEEEETQEHRSGHPPEKKRSVGVQVDLSLPGPQQGACLGDPREEDVEEFPDNFLFSDQHADMKCSPLLEQVLADTVVLSFLESATNYDSLADAAVQASSELTSEGLQSSPVTHKLLWLDTDSCDDEVCVSPAAPEEPLLASISTVSGVAYSPSTLDGAVTRHQAGVLGETKLKSVGSVDEKLWSPCVVELVDILKVPKMAAKLHKNSSLPKDLRQHTGYHTGRRLCCFTSCGSDVWRLRMQTCGICGKVFGRRKILRRHERFHTGEKPYRCSHCPRTFSQKKSLHHHRRFHTGERPHVCPHCGKSFRLRENLKAHLRFHTGKKPFGCDKCGRTFRLSKNLDVHKLSQCGFFVPSFKTLAGMKL